MLYIDKEDFERLILLPLLPGCWDYNCAPHGYLRHGLPSRRLLQKEAKNRADHRDTKVKVGPRAGLRLRSD